MLKRPGDIRHHDVTGDSCHRAVHSPLIQRTGNGAER
jgi:hypothetical protein